MFRIFLFHLSIGRIRRWESSLCAQWRHKDHTKGALNCEIDYGSRNRIDKTLISWVFLSLPLMKMCDADCRWISAKWDVAIDREPSPSGREHMRRVIQPIDLIVRMHIAHLFSAPLRAGDVDYLLLWNQNVRTMETNSCKQASAKHSFVERESNWLRRSICRGQGGS